MPPTLRADDKYQQFHASNISPRIGEALEARVKDPLWFLAQQWQTGEFEAENGGRPAQMAIQSQDWPFENVIIDKKKRPFNRAAPLEAQVEFESEPEKTSPAWQAEALEYEFEISTKGHLFKADSYDGRALDWYHFDVAASVGMGPNKRTLKTQRISPTQLYFRGAPHPRWWRLEEGDAYFESPNDPEPNVLSLLLPEFFNIDIDNWYVVPMAVEAGCLHQVTSLTVADSFGVTSEGRSAIDNDPADDFVLFAPAASPGSEVRALNGRYLLVPNIAADILHNDELEEVRFVRDEQANMVWAWERRIVDEGGASIVTGTDKVGESVRVHRGEMPQFVLKSATARTWIPYVPRQKPALEAPESEIILRRARTDESATAEHPQYQSQIVRESVRILEEEIPPSGLRVKRIRRSAKGSDGTQHFWIGREKEAGRRTARPGLKFDYLVEE